MSQTTKGFIVLTLAFHREDRSWVGICRELGVAANDGSLEKLKAHLADLIQVHLDGLASIGERERVFKERGIRLYTEDLPQEIDAKLPVDGDTLVEAKWLPIELSSADLDLATV